MISSPITLDMYLGVARSARSMFCLWLLESNQPARDLQADTLSLFRFKRI